MSQVALRRTALLLALTACNQVYGLDETTPLEAEDVDSDDDGVLDIVDVCPDIPNPRQEDLDGDRIGDDCDACPTGSNHNEDGDDFLDGCDNCPADPNNDQANVDADDLGDLCDNDNAAPQHRERFDGFETLSADWIPGYVEWHVADDSVQPNEPPTNYDTGLWSRQIEVSTPWLIETTFELAEADSTFAGIQTHLRIGAKEHICYVLYNTMYGWTLNTEGRTLAIARQTGPIRLRMRGVGTVLSCEIPGVATITSTSQATPRTNPGIYTNVTETRFRYVDAISTR